MTTTTAAAEHVVRDIDQLTELLGQPSGRAVDKELQHLDEHCRAFVTASPFVLLGTAGADGRCDVSPRGDGPGAVVVLDDRTLVLAERPGNRRLDSLRNVLANPHVGLLFLVPGREDTLRVNGTATVVRDPELLARCAAGGRTPQMATVVHVEEAFLHCAKAFRRSRLWEPGTWPDPAALPTLGCMLKDHVGLPEPVEEIDRSLEAGTVATLY